MGKIEDIITRHSQRGMDILKKHMADNYCRSMARELLDLNSGCIMLTTGFFVAGYAETDGPPGTIVLAKALRKLGFRPVIITDKYCRDFFENDQIEVVYMKISAGRKAYQQLIEAYHPAAVISVERCGCNVNDDYANMRGDSVKQETARLDYLFEIAAELGIETFGIGDGGNEIGMGNLRAAIENELSLCPCRTGVDHLVIATVSNWGAYAVVAYLQQMTKKSLLPSAEEIRDYLKFIVRIGCVDGVTRKPAATVDGYPPEIEKEIIEALHAAI